MTQKDLDDLCTLVSVHTQCVNLFEALEQAKKDVPEELKYDLDCLYYSIKDSIMYVGNYIEDKKDIFTSE